MIEDSILKSVLNQLSTLGRRAGAPRRHGPSRDSPRWRFARRDGSTRWRHRWVSRSRRSLSPKMLLPSARWARRRTGKSVRRREAC